MLIRIFLGLTGLALAAFGGWFLYDPIAAAAQLGLIVSGANASFEMRGIYGGVSLALGLLGIAGAAREGLRRPALWAFMAYFGGYTLARGLSLAIGEAPTGAFVGYAIFEVTVAALTALSLRALESARISPNG